MATYNKFNSGSESIAEVQNLGADALKVMLTNTAPVAGNSVIADITEIAAGNGYTAGGAVATLVSSSQTGGVYKLVLNSVSWTASGGNIGPYRYAVLYNSVAAGGPLIAWWDNGAPITVPSGQPAGVNFHPTNGVLTIT